MVAMGLALNGCTRCGPIWDDCLQSRKSCKSDIFGTLAATVGVAIGAVIC
jgi:hypothetical protein